MTNRMAFSHALRGAFYCLILTGTAFGQIGVRYDNRVSTVASNVPVGANAPVLAIPNALVTICMDGNCITKASVWSDEGLSVPTSNPMRTDGQGRYGFWALAGNYFYKVVLPSGKVVGIFPFSLGGSGGTGGGINQLGGDVQAGPATGFANAQLVVATTTPGACGDATHVCAITTDAKGRTIAQAAVAIASAGTIAHTNNVIKGDNAGNAIAATPGTDYVIPSGNTATATLATNSSAVGGVALAGLCQTGGTGCPAGGTGTVTTVSVTTANGVSGSVATATTTPAITLTLGAITPTSVSSTGPIASGATPPTACGSATGCMALTEASTAGTPTASQAYIRADSTSHTFKSSINNSSEASLTQTIASGTSALGTSAIASGACATAVTTTATGTATTDAIIWNPNGSIKAVTGYVPSTSGGLTIAGYPTTNAVNWDVCNWTSASITPGAVTLNWRVAR